MEMNQAASDLVRISPNGTKVRTIPATVQRFAPSTPLRARLRVAAYARVSTDEEEQLSSYEAQVDYYTHYIQSNPEWSFVEVYADEGLSGTNTKKRRNFNRMIDDALAGKIDRIVTKSVSRFARNTVDTLTTIRKLKEKGVGVTFEKENIDTLDSGRDGAHLCAAGTDPHKLVRRSLMHCHFTHLRTSVSSALWPFPSFRPSSFRRGSDPARCALFHDRP